MKKFLAVLGVLLVLAVVGLGVANFGFANTEPLKVEAPAPAKIVGLMVWDQEKAEYRTEAVQISRDGPPALLICEMPGSTAAKPVYAIQPWQPLLSSPAKREEYTSGSP